MCPNIKGKLHGVWLKGRLLKFNTSQDEGKLKPLRLSRENTCFYSDLPLGNLFINFEWLFWNSVCPWISISHVMLKKSFIWFVFVNISLIYFFLKFLYSFFAFCKWSISTKPYLLLAKRYLLFHSICILHQVVKAFKTEEYQIKKFYLKVSLILSYLIIR